MFAAVVLSLGIVEQLLLIPSPPKPLHESMCCPGPPPRVKSIDLEATAKALKDPATRTRAANHLAEYLEDHDPPEGTRLLIPWIGDPAWAKETYKGARMLVLRRVGYRAMPEGLPALLRAVEEDPSQEFRAQAAWALGEIGDPAANAAMRRALATTDDKKTITEALMKTGGFTSAEIVPAVEAFMTGHHDNVLGMVAAFHAERDDVAATLLRLLDEELLDGPGVLNTVLRSKHLRRSSAAQIAALRARGGLRAGVAAAILGDPEDQRKLLEGNDVEAIRVLVALARIRGDALPEAVVKELPRRLPATSTVVEAYLAAEAMR